MLLKRIQKDGLDEVLPGGGVRFAVFSGLLTASADPLNRKTFSGVASSTVKDLHGDRMTENAIERMRASAERNMTIFLNHEYRVPEDVAGSVTRAWTSQALDDDGSTMVLLSFDVVVNEENERAIKAWSAIKSGAKLGLSIGAMIPDGGATWDKQAGGYIIDDVELLETSIVGLPANPKSWVTNAVKALNARAKAAQPVAIGAPQVTLDADTGEYMIRGRMNDIAMARTATPAAEPATDSGARRIADPESEQDGNAHLEANDEAAGDHDRQAAPAAGEPVEPGTQDSTITVIQIDTGNESGDNSSAGSSDESDPENGAPSTADGAVPATRALELVGSSARALTSTNELIRALSTEIEALQAQLGEANARADEAERLLRDVVTRSIATLEQVKNIPVGRRAVETHTVVDSFERSIGEVYSAAALKVLRQK